MKKIIVMSIVFLFVVGVGSALVNDNLYDVNFSQYEVFPSTTLIVDAWHSAGNATNSTEIRLAQRSSARHMPERKR
jgi:hypothetical protein